MSKVTPYELGQSAYDQDIKALCHDQEMLDWLRENTDGRIGSGEKPMKEWLAGWENRRQSYIKSVPL